MPILVNSNILPDSLYVYGVDFMTNKNLKDYFYKYVEVTESDGALISES